VWKIYRSGCASILDRKFSLSAAFSDLSSLLVDFTAMISGFCYMLASIVFLTDLKQEN
jgi:hypothetical protein